MKKILLASDSHGFDSNLRRIIQLNTPLDMFIFCGDGEGLEQSIRRYVGEDCEIHMVKGNNDFYTDLPDDEIFEIGKCKAFLTHGHKHRVYYGPYMAADAARDAGCDILFYGHTHVPEMNNYNGVLCVNPGSISLPRQADGRPTFMLIEEDDQRELHFSLGHA